METAEWEPGAQEAQAHLQKFWFVDNPGKISENPGKFRHKCSDTFVLFEKCDRLMKNVWIWISFLQKKRKHEDLSFEGHTKKHSNLLCLPPPKSLPHKHFSCKFGKIRAKMFRTRKISLLLHLHEEEAICNETQDVNVRGFQFDVIVF